MLFNSFEFAVFFPAITILYFILRHEHRPALLLFASCIFYMALIPQYIVILAILIAIDYWMAILIENHEGSKKRRYLAISVFSTCLMLFVFKYFNFFNANIYALAKLIGWNYSYAALRIALPIGLSFHTFQSLSYIFEVYNGRQKAERNFWIYALYVMFYPQLVAGPIERPQNLLHQFRETHQFEWLRVKDGLKLMMWGLFKKIVIADRLAIFVDLVYNNPTAFTGTPLLIATFFFAFQIYCDFSGYTDIAIGAAQVMGFRLMDNFNRPYFSKNVPEFWKRWHISLSSWFRDYLYIPLGGNRVSIGRRYANLLLVFLVSGLWHGANMTFIVWGAIHGIYVVFHSHTNGVFRKLAEKTGLSNLHTIHKIIRIAITFILVDLAWVFFRANSLNDAIYILTHMFSNLSFQIPETLLSREVLIVNLGVILFLEIVHLMQRHQKMRSFLSDKPFAVRWFIYFSLVICVLLLIALSPDGVIENRKFIYFQF